MANIEYQNKIVSLLDDLTEVFEDIVYVFDDMISVKSKVAFKKVSLKESEIKIDEFRKELGDLALKAEDLAKDLWQAAQNIDCDLEFEDVDEVSERILNLIDISRIACKSYERVKKLRLLDAGLIKNKNSLTKNLEYASGYILEYNKTHTQQLKTLKELLQEVEELDRLTNIQLYEEIFGEKE